MRWRGVLLVAGLVALAGCGGGGDKATAASSGTAPPTTLERQVPSGSSTSTAPLSTTVSAEPEVGLPRTFPIPGSSVLTLGPGSSVTNGVTIIGVPLADVRSWIMDGLAAGGYTVTMDDGADNIAFVGAGTSGTVVLTEGPASIDATFNLGPPPG